MSRGLAFVELTVADWPAAVAWYRDVLGLEVVLRDDVNRFALLGTGPGRVALKAGPSQPGGVLLAFEVADLAAEAGRLARHGVTPEGDLRASPEGYRRLLACDPDGYRICLFDWAGRS